jgi:hypothetical protein
VFRRIQVSVIGDWTANWPDPSAYLPAFFACRGSDGNGSTETRRSTGKCNERSGSSSPIHAKHKVWESVDRRLTDAAVWAPTVTFRNVELTSSRIHNYVYNPVWGFLPDQSWLN